MSRDSIEGMFPSTSGRDSDEDAYQAGYDRMMREAAWARSRGWMPTQRQLVVALTRTVKVYGAARGGKFVGGQRPEWLHGRADALRTLLHEGVGAIPRDTTLNN